MAFDQPIEAVRNRKTLKLFIIVDDTLENRYKVINPGGEIIILPDLLFDEDPLVVPIDKIDEEFTGEQLAAFTKHNEKLAAAAKMQAERPPTVTKAPPAEPPKPRSLASRQPKKPPDNGRRGLGATWNSPRLSFYKHKIEPLGLKQSFKIVVEGTGEFEITKEEFLVQFNDVVMSSSYRADGLYTYPKIPDKALRYLKGRG